MKAPRHQISSTVATKTYQDGVSKEYAREVAAYLLETGRTRELESVLRDVVADWAERGYVEVIARSAHPLDAAVKADIRARVQNLYPAAEKVVVTEVADPSVIGGVQIQIANERLDLSVEAKLNKFKQLTTAGKE